MHCMHAYIIEFCGLRDEPQHSTRHRKQSNHDGQDGDHAITRHY